MQQCRLISFREASVISWGLRQKNSRLLPCAQLLADASDMGFMCIIACDIDGSDIRGCIRPDYQALHASNKRRSWVQ